MDSMVFKRGSTPWNKGKTKETDQRIAQYGKKGGASRTGKRNLKESATKKRLFAEGKIPQLRENAFQKGNVPWDKGKKRPDISEGQRGSENHRFGKHPSDKTRAIWSAQRKNVPKSADHKFADSLAIKQKWKDAEWAAKVSRSLHVSPNNDERHIDRLLERYFPGVWKFTGDGKDREDWINGKCPDWQRKDGKRIVIEYNGYRTTAGDRGHTLEKDIKKTEEYNNEGYQVINLYPDDIKDEERFLQVMNKKLQRLHS